MTHRAGPLTSARTSPDGGIGRRARFRSVCRKAWRFESSSGHQIPVSDRPARSRSVQKARQSGLFLLLERPGSSRLVLLASERFVGTPVGVSMRCQQAAGWIPTMPLTDTQVKNIKVAPTPKKHSDGGGLHLLGVDSGRETLAARLPVERKAKDASTRRLSLCFIGRRATETREREKAVGVRCRSIVSEETGKDEDAHAARRARLPHAVTGQGGRLARATRKEQGGT